MNELIVFVDGACSGNPGPGGFGFFILDTRLDTVTEYGSFQDSVTNNIMELRGLIEALKVLEKKDFSGSTKIRIFMDSQYVLKGAETWLHGWKRNNWKKSDGGDVMNLSLWQELDSLLQTIKNKKWTLEWNYVEAHAGNPANERVDEIAVSFSKKIPVNLFQGSIEKWGVDVNQSTRSVESQKILEYLSLVNGIVQTHKTWKDCEARVKGIAGAKFKKVQSLPEKTKLLKDWGF